MDVTVTIVMMIPVILAVALIINVIRKNITEREAGDPVNITGVIPAVIVLVVAVMIIGSMGAAIAPYSWDEDSGELTINADVGSGAQAWDSYGADVKSLIINGNVETVADGAFDTLTGLEYISISDSVTSLTSSAFGVTLKDYLDQTITAPEAGGYVGGSGTLYYCDASIYTYDSDGDTITGLTSDASGAKILVIPSVNDGTDIKGIATDAFRANTNIVRLDMLPDSPMTTLGNNVVRECTSLTFARLSETVTNAGNDTFNGCTSLETVILPSDISKIGNGFFRSCTSLPNMDIPETVTSIGISAYASCTMTSFAFPAAVETILTNAFGSCTSVTSVSFADGFAADINANAFGSWTFYDSDGTTVIDKTDADALAGYTFQGTASALVKQTPVLLGSPEDTEEQELTDATEEIQMLSLEQTETKTAELSVEEKELASA